MSDMNAGVMTFGECAPILIGNGCRPVPIKKGTKRPPMPDWRNFKATPETIAQYAHCWTGVILGDLAVADIDVLDEETSEEIYQLARRMLGSGLLRVGQAPKMGVFYRASVPFRKLVSRSYLIAGKPTKVEFLGEGQQAVIVGVHPDTKRPYYWVDGDLLTTPVADLPEVGADAARNFLVAADVILARHGTLMKPEVVSAPTPILPSVSVRDGTYRQRKYVETAIAREVDELAGMPPDSGRNDRLNIAACKLGRFIPGGWLDRGRAEALLEAAATRCGLVKADGVKSVRDTIRSGLGAGARTPKSPPAASNGKSNGRGEPAVEDDSPVEKIEHDEDGVVIDAVPTRHIPAWVWESRAVLWAIRAYAHASGCPADAALGYLLARWSAAMPTYTRLYAGTLKPTPPNLFVGIIAPSGSAKSSTATQMDDVIELHVKMAEILASTGEGICRAFMGDPPEENLGLVDGLEKKQKAKKGKPKEQEMIQVLHNGFLSIDEGTILKRLGARDGTTLPMILRQGHTGTPMGQTNATRGLSRRVEGYNLGCVANFTPGGAGALFDRSEAEGGTPQRFLFFLALDPEFQKDAPRADKPEIITRTGANLIRLERELEDEFREYRAEIIRGERTIDPLDGHKPLIVFRIAAFLCVQEQRIEVNRDDWEIAVALWNVSCAVRSWVKDQVAAQVEEEKAEKNRDDAVRAVVLSTATKNGDATIHRLATNIANYVHREGDKTPGWKIRNNAMMGAEQRGLFEPASKYAESLGWLKIEATGKHWSPGKDKPDAS